MRLRDHLDLTSSAILAHRTRSLLTGLGIAVGIAAVVLLMGIGFLAAGVLLLWTAMGAKKEEEPPAA